MTTPFRIQFRVAFHETDTANIVHFSNFFRYMEVAEVEFLRSRGLHVSWRDGEARYGFPRVSASCDFFKPARFEDLIDVTVTVEKVGAKSVSYKHEFHLNGELIARGKITAVFVNVGPDHALKSAEIPAEIRAKLME